MLDTIVECEPALVQAPSPPEIVDAPQQTEELPLQVIEPPRGWQLVNLRELWRYRELFYFFTWRDVKIRYKQTLLGAGWAVVQPFMMMVVFTIFLGGMANVDSGDYPYPVFVYAGLLPWTFFATAITTAGNSLLGARQIVTKVYFPRLAVPFASVGAALVDFAIAFGMLLVLMAYYGVQPGWGLLLVPLLVPVLMFAALGVGTLLAALNVAYRDFKYTIPFLVQIWMFATPTVYMNLPQETEHSVAAATTTVSVDDIGKSGTTTAKRQAVERNRLPAELKPLLQLNPMTGVIAFFRASVLGGPLPWGQLCYPVALIAVFFCGGVAYFRRVESSFADII